MARTGLAVFLLVLLALLLSGCTEKPRDPRFAYLESAATDSDLLSEYYRQTEKTWREYSTGTSSWEATAGVLSLINADAYRLQAKYENSKPPIRSYTELHDAHRDAAALYRAGSAHLREFLHTNNDAVQTQGMRELWDAFELTEYAQAQLARHVEEL